MAAKEEELQSFLEKVDQIASIVSGLNSNADGGVTDALKLADNYIREESAKAKKKNNSSTKNTGVNRTVINDVPKNEKTSSDVSREEFMAYMEKDAKERSERRKANEKSAYEFKEKGNVEFRNGDYEKAIDLYTKGLTHARDITALWTNRAQAYARLGNYENSIKDCDWVIKTFGNCVKAFIHKGKAMRCLQRYDEAIESYQMALKLDPKLENVVADYIKEVEHARLTGDQEEHAHTLFESGDTHARGVVDILDRINKEGQPIIYYSGGLRVLQDMMREEHERTLVRTHGGLVLTQTHSCIKRCFDVNCPQSLSQEEMNMCAATIELYSTAIKNNEENQRVILDSPNFAIMLPKFVQLKAKRGRHLSDVTVAFLYQMSQTTMGRLQVIIKLDLERLLSALLAVMKLSGNVAVNSSITLSNLSIEKKFRVHLRDFIEKDVIQALESFMSENFRNPAILPNCITVVANISGDPVIRKILTKRLSLLEISTNRLGGCDPYLDDPVMDEMILSLLGLLINLTTDITEKTEINKSLASHYSALCKQCFELVEHKDSTVALRSLGIISHIVPHVASIAEDLTKKGLPQIVLNRLQAGELYPQLLRCLIKALTSCTQHSEAGRQIVAKDKKAVKTLLDLLHHDDEIVVGNTALCLSHCTDVGGFSEGLVDTSIVKDALVLARDMHKPAVQLNCAILIAKLSQSDARHLVRLRELDGIGILHGCIKTVN